VKTLLSAVLLGVGLRAAGAQAPTSTLRGHVRGPDGTPIHEAVVRLTRTRVQRLTALDGGFAITRGAAADTLVVTAIGFLPDTLVIAAFPADTVAITLRDAPLVLSALVGTTSPAQPLASGEAATWSVSGKAIAALPAVIEPDVSRALALVPGVSFGSLVSARPILRGLSADDVVTAIDGFPAINLYHAGRLFSSIPAVAVDHADVEFQPADAAIGGTTAGVVDITGRSSPKPGGAEVQVGGGASSGAAGISNATGNASLFVAARTAKTSLINQQLAENDLQYDFGDVYANAHDVLAGKPVQFSFFSSSDHLATDSIVAGGSTARMHWSNLVIGARSDLLHGTSGSLTGSLSYARHIEDGHDVVSRGTLLDIASGFAALTGRLDGSKDVSAGVVARIGVAVTHHDIQNEITPEEPGADFVADQKADPLETAGYAALAFGASRVTATAGVRVEHAPDVTAVEPRVSLRLGSGTGWIAMGVGRSVRLFDLVSDAESETSNVYYNFWLPGGADGNPLEAMTNGSLEAAHAIGRWQFRADLFGSSGSGVADLTPFIIEQDTAQLFRFGRSRAYGGSLSAVAGEPDGHWSVALSYTYAVSERNWGEGWVPSISDRRHQGRIFGTFRALPTIHLSTSIELASPLPYTPITAWVVVPDDQAFDQLRPVFGAEMSGRGTALLRIDAALVKRFNGPAHSRWDAGVGVSNLSWGDQSARTQSLYVNQFGTPALSVKTAFAFRAVPSIIVRGEIGTIE
jgi:hypothetical protein